MLKIDKSFFDVIDIARDLLGPLDDRADVHPEYQRAVLELVADLSVGTEGHARMFLADSLGLDHDVLYLRVKRNETYGDTDLPSGYRWATPTETQEHTPGAIVVPRTVDSSGHPYTGGEADIAVPLPSRSNNDVVITPETLLEWTGSLTTAQVARLAESIQHSSVPDAVGEIGNAIRTNSDDHGWIKGGVRADRLFRDDDSGDVGGDIQTGPAHSLSWQRALADDTFETLTLYHFAATNDPSDTKPMPWAAWVETMIELVRHRDANDPGGTELVADYRYESRVSHPSLAEALDAARRYTTDNQDIDPQTLWWEI